MCPAALWGPCQWTRLCPGEALSRAGAEACNALGPFPPTTPPQEHLPAHGGPPPACQPPRLCPVVSLTHRTLYRHHLVDVLLGREGAGSSRCAGWGGEGGPCPGALEPFPVQATVPPPPHSSPPALPQGSRSPLGPSPNCPHAQQPQWLIPWGDRGSQGPESCWPLIPTNGVNGPEGFSGLSKPRTGASGARTSFGWVSCC